MIIPMHTARRLVSVLTLFRRTMRVQYERFIKNSEFGSIEENYSSGLCYYGPCALPAGDNRRYRFSFSDSFSVSGRARAWLYRCETAERRRVVRVVPGFRRAMGRRCSNHGLAFDQGRHNLVTAVRDG